MDVGAAMSNRNSPLLEPTGAAVPLKTALRKPEYRLVGSPPMEAFMVRIWRPMSEERSEGVRGVAVHLGSGRQITFSEPRRLIDFLAEAGGAADGSALDLGSPPTSVQE